MMTVKEVSRLTGVSIRALQYYDRIGLFHPSGHTEAGYRLYDEADLETLQQILLFRELEFPLKDIRKIIRSPGFDRSKALDQQIGLLKLKKEHIENLIDLAERIKETEVGTLSFDAFDTGKLEKYAAQAKASWGATPAYQEYEKKSKNRTEEETRDISRGLMDIFAEFGSIRTSEPGPMRNVKSRANFTKTCGSSGWAPAAEARILTQKRGRSGTAATRGSGPARGRSRRGP